MHPSTESFVDLPAARRKFTAQGMSHPGGINLETQNEMPDHAGKHRFVGKRRSHVIRRRHITPVSDLSEIGLAAYGRGKLIDEVPDLLPLEGAFPAPGSEGYSAPPARQE